MHIALLANPRTSDSPAQAVYTRPETLESIRTAMTGQGHRVTEVDASQPLPHWVSALEGTDPDLVFNLAEGTTAGTTWSWSAPGVRAPRPGRDPARSGVVPARTVRR